MEHLDVERKHIEISLIKFASKENIRKSSLLWSKYDICGFKFEEKSCELKNF